MISSLPQLCEYSLWLHLFSAPVLLGFAQTSQAHGILALQASVRNKKIQPRCGKCCTINIYDKSQKSLFDQVGWRELLPGKKMTTKAKHHLKAQYFRRKFHLGECFNSVTKTWHCSMNQLIYTLIFTYLKWTCWSMLMSGLKEHPKHGEKCC